MSIADRDQHTVHRLEAFSDIVIGFCLAQSAINLAFPKSPADQLTVWLNTNFLLVSFVIIAVLWWLHHRTFSALFVLTTGTVVLNFAILGSLVLSLYLLQVFIHAVASGQSVLLFLRLWIASYLLVYALMGALMLAGIILRQGRLPVDDLRWAVQRLVVIAASVLFLAYLAFSGFAQHPHGILYISLAWAVLMAFVGRVLVPRLLRRLIPNE